LATEAARNLTNK